ncbi:hypothetical protein EVAR_82159_1 [Eumeta japonica]|uniref:Uncharacterized protein n=1 Tax=Eumeta variegata TaxID=151549 RepID=A0A4C1U1Q4_EUMVA|nr:hypothetical protein EVAR_82159_1 [Eumeta japonica]
MTPRDRRRGRLAAARTLPPAYVSNVEVAGITTNGACADTHIRRAEIWKDQVCLRKRRPQPSVKPRFCNATVTGAARSRDRLIARVTHHHASECTRIRLYVEYVCSPHTNVGSLPRHKCRLRREESPVHAAAAPAPGALDPLLLIVVGGLGATPPRRADSGGVNDRAHPCGRDIRNEWFSLARIKNSSANAPVVVETSDLSP